MWCFVLPYLCEVLCWLSSFLWVNPFLWVSSFLWESDVKIFRASELFSSFPTLHTEVDLLLQMWYDHLYFYCKLVSKWKQKDVKGKMIDVPCLSTTSDTFILFTNDPFRLLWSTSFHRSVWRYIMCVRFDEYIDGELSHCMWWRNRLKMRKKTYLLRSR